MGRSLPLHRLRIVGSDLMTMGAEVVKQVPAHLRATAFGGFAAFQDLSYGATGPIVGLLADRSGYASVFLVGALAATLALAIAISTRKPALTAAAQSDAHG